VCPEPVSVEEKEMATHLYRIAQEAVNNALKHSGATKLEIDLRRKDGLLRLQITDNGKGIESSAPEGLGLRVMNHRAAVIGAELQIQSKPLKGVRVLCLVTTKQRRERAENFPANTI
jgi:signal transduction histidine kinase